MVIVPSTRREVGRDPDLCPELDKDFELLAMSHYSAYLHFGRALAIYLCCALFARSALRIDQRHQLILFWGGLRGALALALVLGLSTQVPRSEEIITVTFAVVAFSIFAQGLTMTPLLNRMGEIPKK